MKMITIIASWCNAINISILWVTDYYLHARQAIGL
jgi:hypothetical protein